MDETILIKFLTLLASQREKMRDYIIYMEGLDKFKKVYYSGGIYFRPATKNPATSMGIDANFYEAVDNELLSIGVSFEILKTETNWILQGEVGWSGYQGFDTEYSIEEEYSDIERLFNSLEKNVDLLLQKYESLMNDYLIQTNNK